MAEGSYRTTWPLLTSFSAIAESSNVMRPIGKPFISEKISAEYAAAVLLKKNRLAPTVLEAAGVEIPDAMTGRSLLPIFKSAKSGRVEEERSYTVFGRERHTPAQKFPSMEGYPSRGIRTDDFLLIINFKPDLWPAGIPKNSTRGTEFADCDGGPTKSWILKHRNDERFSRYYRLCFGKRPEFELYDLGKDPEQIKNVAYREEYTETVSQLKEKLLETLKESADPRVCTEEPAFDSYKYYGRMKKIK